MPDNYVAARQRLVEEIVEEVRETRQWLGKDALDPRVIEAILTVPRHEFVAEHLQPMAYLNRPLPIGNAQTISQPYIIAIMTDLLAIPEDGRVLEVGTGCGYQAAILAQLCASVYSIEIVQPLGHEAKARLERLGYDNVYVRIGDGFAGWPEAGPFDAIIVTAAADEVPPPLVEQLKPGGRMICPVESGFGGQELVLIEKDNQGSVHSKDVLPVRFVPLTGDHE
jgi:protein-L-isoaspartate(D-aspartate) O-methyltransferase